MRGATLTTWTSGFHNAGRAYFPLAWQSRSASEDEQVVHLSQGPGNLTRRGAFLRRVALPAGAVLIVLAAVAGRALWLERNRLPEGLVQANGRIEGDHVAIASKFAGRVEEVLVREGERVTAGQVLVRLDDRQLEARVRQAQHAVAVSRANVAKMEAEARAAAAQVKAAETALQLMRKQVPLVIDRAVAELEHAKAAAASADSTEGIRLAEYQRAQELRQKSAVTDEELDQKKLAWMVAANELTTAQTAVTKADKLLDEARLGYDQIRQEEDGLVALQAKHAKALAEIDEFRARVDESRATLEELQSMLDDLTIVAPCDGTITARMVERGEVVSAGSALYDLVDLNRLYLQVYVPESQIGQVSLGLPSRVYVDAFPDAPYSATVRYISSQAEFTPKEVQTRDERVKLVYAVRLYLDENPAHRLTPGLPADAIIRWQENAPWVSPRW